MDNKHPGSFNWGIQRVSAVTDVQRSASGRADRTLRVRLIADRAHRIRTVQRLHHLNEHDAIDWLERTEQERTLFMRRNFNVDPADPHLYDLLLNTARLSIAECADIIAQVFVQYEARIVATASALS